jgi:hypothetical protein
MYVYYFNNATDKKKIFIRNKKEVLFTYITKTKKLHYKT